VNIPDEAWDAVVKAVPLKDVLAAKGSAWDINELQERAVRAAAPWIEAAALERIVTERNIAVTIGSPPPRPLCGWPADNAQPGPCGRPGETMVMVSTFDEPPLATLNPGDEKPSILVLCAKHGQVLGGWSRERRHPPTAGSA
jgi:hypothetical protein